MRVKRIVAFSATTLKMFNFDTETTEDTSSWPFSLPEPHQTPTELDIFASTCSSLYNLPIGPSLTAANTSSCISPSLSGLFHYPHPSPPHTTAMTEKSITTPTAAPSLNPSTDANIMAPNAPNPSPPRPLFSERDTSPLRNPSPPPPFPESGHDKSLPTTHAARNPHLPIQQSRTHPKLSVAQQATKALHSQATKDKRSLLLTAVQELQEKHEKEYEALAHEHLVAVEYIRKIVSTTQFKMKRGVSLQNAKIHAKAVEVNAGVSHRFFPWFLTDSLVGRDVGERMKLSEIKQLVKDDPLLQDLSTEQEETLRQGVRDFRDHKRMGARVTNQATAQVFRHGFGVATDLVRQIEYICLAIN
jgi:hypothetical protein